MPFEYSCFISYRHGQRKTAERLVGNLYEVLADEIGLWLNEEVFLDRERLQGGDFYNERLARALCQSVCMRVVFTPIYFDKAALYCAREFRAMERLEQQRLRALGNLRVEEHGLIIPIICRGASEVPSYIRERRHCYDFEKYYLGNDRLPRSGKFRDDIRRIAEYILARQTELAALAPETADGCLDFRLPDEDEVNSWLTSQLARRSLSAPAHSPFPFR